MENSIAFIICGNNEEMYNESLLYIDNLIVPDGFEIEKIVVKDAKSITSAYNEAMKKSISKYKVYLHQDTFIINRNFINDMLNIFSRKNIGMFGAIGCCNLPQNAIWWESLNKYGMVYENSSVIMKKLAFYEAKTTEDFAVVESIDGFIMVTQYDVEWREDIFDGWHFYDASQCTEFRKKGYDVVVPKQDTPWFVHDCGIINVSNGYDEYRHKFIEEYYN